MGVTDVLTDILDIAPSPEPRKGMKRSPEWPEVQKAFIASHPRCAICSGKESLNVHHVVPFEFGGAELDPANLITLCRGTFNCHLLFGHLGDYKSMNPLVRSDAEIWSFRMRARRILTRMVRQEAKATQGTNRYKSQ